MPTTGAVDAPPVEGRGMLLGGEGLAEVGGGGAACAPRTESPFSVLSTWFESMLSSYVLCQSWPVARFAAQECQHGVQQAVNEEDEDKGERRHWAWSTGGDDDDALRPGGCCAEGSSPRAEESDLDPEMCLPRGEAEGDDREWTICGGPDLPPGDEGEEGEEGEEEEQGGGVGWGYGGGRVAEPSWDVTEGSLPPARGVEATAGDRVGALIEANVRQSASEMKALLDDTLASIQQLSTRHTAGSGPPTVSPTRRGQSSRSYAIGGGDDDDDGHHHYRHRGHLPAPPGRRISIGADAIQHQLDEAQDEVDAQLSLVKSMIGQALREETPPPLNPRTPRSPPKSPRPLSPTARAVSEGGFAMMGSDPKSPSKVLEQRPASAAGSVGDGGDGLATPDEYLSSAIERIKAMKSTVKSQSMSHGQVGGMNMMMMMIRMMEMRMMTLREIIYVGSIREIIYVGSIRGTE
jgi:hypothetical protein